MTEQEHLARCDSQPSLGETSLVWQPSYLLGRELLLAAEDTMQNSPPAPQETAGVEKNPSASLLPASKWLGASPSSSSARSETEIGCWGKACKTPYFWLRAVPWLFTL